MVQTKYSGTGWWNRPFVLGVLEMRSSVSRVFRLREGNLVRRVYFSPWSERERERETPGSRGWQEERPWERGCVTGYAAKEH